MKVFRSFKLPRSFHKAALAIGNFDGVHKGHAAVINKAKSIAQEKKIKLGVLTFEPHPKCFFSEKFDFFRLTNFREKFLILKNYKVDFLVNIKFNSEFLKISAESFILNNLIKDLNVSDVITGFDFVFGNKKKGNVELMKSYSHKTKYFKYHEVSEIKKNNLEISSSVIRSLIRQGKIIEANKLLARNWSVSSFVKSGKKNGRKIGFKTANVEVNKFCNLAFGVYLVKVQIPKMFDMKYFYGIANYGVKPTVENIDPLLEVHIFDFNEDIYFYRMNVEFINFIRAEKKFESLEKLKSQIIKDIKQAKNDRLFKNN